MQSALIAHELRVFRGAMQLSLHQFGFETCEATDQNSMFVLLAKQKPQLLLIDSKFPPFGAAEAIRAARGFDSGGTKIVAVVADNDFALAANLRGIGANDVILGGYTADKLRQKLRAVGLIGN